MNSSSLYKELQRTLSKKDVMFIANSISGNNIMIDELFQLLHQGNTQVSSRASWVFRQVIEMNPEVFKHYVRPIVELLEKQPPEAIKRNCYAMLSEFSLPKDLHAPLLDLGLRDLNSMHTSVAVKVFSMTMLGNICQIHPDLANEIRLEIAAQFNGASPGFRSRGKKILKKLDQIIERKSHK